MDKFGIFKLLNSFFSFCEQNKTPNTDKNPQENNGLNDLLSAFTQKPKPEITQSLKEKQPQKTFAPLQSSMLYTMNSHDEFIKRVKSKNPDK